MKGYRFILSHYTQQITIIIISSKSMWNPCDTHVTPMQHPCDTHVKSMFHPCDIHVTSMWHPCEVHVLSMLSLCDPKLITNPKDSLSKHFQSFGRRINMHIISQSQHLAPNIKQMINISTWLYNNYKTELWIKYTFCLFWNNVGWLEIYNINVQHLGYNYNMVFFLIVYLYGLLNMEEEQRTRICHWADKTSYVSLALEHE